MRCQSSMCASSGCMFPQACPNDKDDRSEAPPNDTPPPARAAMTEDKAPENKILAHTRDLLDREKPAIAYLLYFPAMREVARQHGYALGIHGSLNRDFDLIAVAWTPEATDAEALISAICADNQLLVAVRDQQDKPHGRRCWTLKGIAGLPHGWVDLSVIPPDRAARTPSGPDAVSLGRLMVGSGHPCPQCDGPSCVPGEGDLRLVHSGLVLGCRTCGYQWPAPLAPNAPADAGRAGLDDYTRDEALAVAEGPSTLRELVALHFDTMQRMAELERERDAARQDASAEHGRAERYAARFDRAIAERDAARAERDALLEAVGRAVLPELNGDGHKAYPWVKTAVREIEKLGAEAKGLREAVRSVDLIARTMHGGGVYLAETPQYAALLDLARLADGDHA